MTIKMKLVGCLVAAAFLLLSLVTCAAAQEESILDNILKAGVVRVGMGLSWPLFAFRDDKGNPAGFEFEMAKLLAEKLGVKLELVEVAGPTRVSTLVAKKVDIVMSGFARTLERAKSVAFCEVPYMTSGLHFNVSPNSPYKTIEEVQAAGNKVKAGYDRGGTAEPLTKRLFPNAQYSVFDSVPDGYLALVNGVIDIHCEGTLGGASQLHPDKVRSLPGVYSMVEVCAAVPYGDFKWWNWCNLFFYEANARGDTYRLYKQATGVEPEQLIPWIEIEEGLRPLS